MWLLLPEQTARPRIQTSPSYIKHKSPFHLPSMRADVSKARLACSSCGCVTQEREPQHHVQMRSVSVACCFPLAAISIKPVDPFADWKAN